MIQLACPGCGKTSNLPDQAQGLRYGCICGHTFIADGGVYAVGDFKKHYRKPEVQRQRKKICQSCEFYGECPGDYMLDKVCPVGKWVVEWTPVVDHLPEPESDLLVITVATGELTKLLEVTGPNIREYAAWCGADYAELTFPTQSWWGLEKFRVYEIAKRYARTLFLDVDVCIMSKTPNIFEVVPEGHVGMHDDAKYLKHGADWVAAERELLSISQKLPYKDSPTVLNSGVVLCDHASADIWAPPWHPFTPTHCYEQVLVEYRALAHNVFPLPTSLNTQYWMDDFHLLTQSAELIHLATCDTYTRMQLAPIYLKW